jgi:phosphoserine phosphatase RsbU/P
VQAVPERAASQIAELERRHTALRQAASLPDANLGAVLEAAFTEIEEAIAALGAAGASAEPVPGGRAQGTDGAERRLLRAVFSDAPVPLFLLALDGTVLRVNKSAGKLLGAKPGYATGRPVSAFVTLSGRAAVQSQLTAVARSGKIRRVRCSLLGPREEVAGELLIGLARVSGEDDQLIVAVTGAGEVAADTAGDDSLTESPRGVLEAITRRQDMITAVSRLLLENENFSETMTVQRCARLLAGEMAAWVIVDMERRGALRRQLVIGPDGPELASIASAVEELDPPQGSVPHLVHESGQSILVAHAEDMDMLGTGPDDVPLLMVFGATSVLSVPLTAGDEKFGVLTLVRQQGEGHFEIADLGLVEELGGQLAMAIRVAHKFRRRSEIADALQASLLPRHLPVIDGIDLAVAYVHATEGFEVGADFYDVYKIPSGWGLSVGDVCGKGEEAAAVTAVARHAIRVIGHGNATPSEVLAGANEILLAEELNGGFVTAGVAHLSWLDGVLRVASGLAGHPGPAVVRADGQVQVLSGGGVPLGLFDDAQPGVQELTLSRGDILFLYTDGVTQARGRDRTYFSERLADELASLAGRHPDQIVAAMRAALLEFSDSKLIDDFSMMVIRVGESPGAVRSRAKRPGR